MMTSQLTIDRTVALGDAADVQGGLQVSSKRRGLPISVPYLRVANVHRGWLDLEVIKELHVSPGELARTKLATGDLLIVEGHGNKNEIGRVGIWTGEVDPCVHQNHLIRVRCQAEKLVPRFAEAYMNSPVGRRGLLGAANTTSGLNTISTGDVRRLSIPLPPIEEQRRIVAVLDAADALRTKRRQALAKLDTLSQATFIEMFGDPAANTMEWEQVRLGDVLARIDSGRSPVCLDRPAAEGEWGVLKAGAVSYCEFDGSQSKALPPDVEPDTRHEVTVGDVLFARKNTHDLVAACAYIYETPSRLLMSDLIFRLVVDEPCINPIFLQAQLVHTRLRRRIQGLARGSSGSMPNISKSRLSEATICLPPRERQSAFADAVLASRRVWSSMQKDAEATHSLLASLQQRAFRGEL